MTLQYSTLHFFMFFDPNTLVNIVNQEIPKIAKYLAFNNVCLYRPPPNRRNNLIDFMLTEQLPDLLGYINNLPGLVSLVGDINIFANAFFFMLCLGLLTHS